MNRVGKWLRLAFATALAVPAISLVLPEDRASAAFAGGTGTSGDPYQIADCTQLAEIDDSTANLAAHYILTADITCSGSFTPMKNGTTYFSGSLNGNGKKIINLSIDCGSTDFCGLFTRVSSASSNSSFTNITFQNPTIRSTGNYVGTLFGFGGSGSFAADVSNVSVSGGTISGATDTGSIAGSHYRGTLASLSSSAQVTGTARTGGLIGTVGSSVACTAGFWSLNSSSFSGRVEGTNSVGGIVGSVSWSSATSECSISNSSNSGSVVPAASCYNIGGIVGTLSKGTVSSSSNTGAITASACSSTGGIIGSMRGNSSSGVTGSSHVAQSWNTGSVSGSNYVGGVVGYCDSGYSTISRVYNVASVTATTSQGGGIAGVAACVITDAFSRGSISGSTSGGAVGEGLGASGDEITRAYSVSNIGFLGRNSSGTLGSVVCVASFWDSTVRATTPATCGAGLVGKSTSDMKTASTFTSAGWDFTPTTGTWAIDSGVNDGYPYLQGVGVAALTAATVPAAPTITSVTAGDSTLTVAFTAGSDGGSAITNYKYSVDGTNYSALSPTSTTSPITITGLINGTSYPITIKAVNGIGASNASNSVSGTPVASTPSTTTPPTTAAPATPAAPESTTTTSLPTVTRTLTITGAAARYIVTQAGPGLTAVPSDGDGSISWSSLTPSVCNVSSIAMMSILSAQSSIEVGRLSVVGTCTISATVAATSTHSSASTSVSFSVTRARPSLVVDTFDDEHFFAKLTLPAAISGSTALLRSMYEDLRFVVLTPEICEIETIATFQESGSRFGSSWVGLHGAPNYLSDGACAVRAELPLGDRWFRVFSITNATLGEDVEPTTTTATPTTTSTIAPSTTVAPTTTVSATTTVPETTSSAPGITSFGPTSTIATAPVVELDVEKQIVLETGETEIVFTRESLIKTAENVGVRVGAIRLRTASSAWTETKLPDATNLSLVIRRSDVELNIEVAPEVGDIIRIAVPIVINVDGGFGLRNFTLAFLAGASLMAWWLLVWRRRRLVKPVA